MQVNFSLLKPFFLKHQRSELEEVLLSFKRLFYWLLFFTAVINFILLVPALYMFQIYDSVLTTRSFETLLMLTLIALFFFVISGFLNYFRSQILIYVSEELDERLSSRTFQATLEAVLKTGSISPSQAFNDLTTLRQFLTGAPILAFLDAPFTLIYLAVIFIIHPYLGIFALFSGLVAFFLTIYSERVSRRGIQEANRFFQQSQNFLNANLRNVEVIEAMGMGKQVYQKWRTLYDKMKLFQFEASHKAGKIDSLVRSVRISSQSLILGLGAYLAIQDKITPGMMIMGSILMGRALSPIDLVVSTFRQFISARQSYFRLKELYLSYPPPRQRLPLPIPKGYLEVENLYVVPPGAKKEVLKGITFKVNPGELVVIIGPTASGKSTLAKTIVGVWSPALGSVKLDGAELSLYHKEHLGSYIGYLPQDIELFSGTIAENIARFGEIKMDLVVRASMIAGVHEMILALPEGYETEIGEGGSFLSGGQRQRLALARALYGDPLLIVLDEPNSNLDEEGEKALINALLFLKKAGKTILVISHKMNILSLADKLLVLNQGLMRYFGPTKEVLNLLYQQSKPSSKETLPPNL